VVAKGKGPDHYAHYRTEQLRYVLQEGQDELRVPFVWEDESGIKVTKTYIFHRGSYAIDIEHKVENASGQEWQGSYYRQFQRIQSDEGGGMGMVYTYTGGVIYTPEELFEKISFDDIEEARLNRQNVEGGWVGMMQHYFVSAMIPAADSSNTFYSRYHNTNYILGMLAPLEKLEAGGEKTYQDKIYAGPKLQNELEALSPGLDLTVDYGVLTIIAKPLYWVLQFFHGLTGNWGWAIIFLTMSIKLLFYKLSETSYKSMANMRKLQPRMQTLKERFGDDRQGMQQAMMKMYKEEKINPLGGCLPILVQIPVFIALYWVLLESVEMRQAPFILWLQDLSAQDPYYVLPLLMGISMFVQQKLNPAPIDPMQAKIMSALPVVFTVFFIFFPSGLVLYWVVNNILSIAQQWVITRRVESGTDKK
jgi:YidC/Oxa1 family membrane protein insertase